MASTLCTSIRQLHRKRILLLVITGSPSSKATLVKRQGLLRPAFRCSVRQRQQQLAS